MFRVSSRPLLGAQQLQ